MQQNGGEDLAPVTHEDGDEWGIEMEEDAVEPAPQQSGSDLRAAGLMHRYEAGSDAPEEHHLVRVAPEDTLEDLAAQLNAL